MDNNMLIPFEVNLEAIKEQIIKMDHSLKGDALDYVKGLTERAEAFVKEAHEKLEIVIKADEEWTNTEDELNLKMDEVVTTSDGDVGTSEEDSSIDAQSTESLADKTITNDELNQESIKEDDPVEILNDEFNEEYRHDLEEIDLGLSNEVDEQVYYEDLATTERATIEESIEKENNVSKENKEDGGDVIGGISTDQVKETSDPAETVVNIDRKINPKIKLLLEETNFWKINEELTPHQHQESGSWAEVVLPLLIVVPLLAILAGLFAFAKMKKKEIVSVNSLNSWGNDYPCLENVTTMENSNYYKLK